MGVLFPLSPVLPGDENTGPVFDVTVMRWQHVIFCVSRHVLISLMTNVSGSLIIKSGDILLALYTRCVVNAYKIIFI